MAEHNNFGKWAEDQAVEYLQSKGYRIMERNYRYGKAEVDIIAQNDKQIIIVEVKARKNSQYGEPHLFVSPSKIKLLTRAANAYILQNDIDIPVRFDIISITKYPKEINHIEDAFLMYDNDVFLP